MRQPAIRFKCILNLRDFVGESCYEEAGEREEGSRETA